MLHLLRANVPEWREIAALATIDDVANYIFKLRNPVKES